MENENRHRKDSYLTFIYMTLMVLASFLYIDFFFGLIVASVEIFAYIIFAIYNNYEEIHLSLVSISVLMLLLLMVMMITAGMQGYAIMTVVAIEACLVYLFKHHK